MELKDQFKWCLRCNRAFAYPGQHVQVVWTPTAKNVGEPAIAFVGDKRPMTYIDMDSEDKGWWIIIGGLCCGAYHYGRHFVVDFRTHRVDSYHMLAEIYKK